MLSLIVASALLGACAHQSGASRASQEDKAFASDSLQDRQRQQEQERCQAMNAGGRDMAVTDCDVMALDRAASSPTGQTRDNPLNRDIPSLPTQRRLGGL